MKTNKWTPGPWKAIDGIGCGSIYSIQAVNPPSGNGVLAAVLHAPDKLRPLKVAEANAHLIALSPEWPEVVRACLQRLEHYTAGIETCDLVPLDERAINAARALLSKLDA